MKPLHGHHHLTLCVGGVQEDYDFHTKLLGLRSLKKTVLFDGKAPIYHLYYGNETGDPSTLITTFSFRQSGLKAERGTEQTRTVSVSVPHTAIDFWKKRLEEFGMPYEEIEVFGDTRLRFYHPSGIEYDLVANKNDSRKGRAADDIPEENAIQGLHGITVSVRDMRQIPKFMEMGMGFENSAIDGQYSRFEVAKGGPGNIVEFIEEPDKPQGSWFYGEGMVHHCAFDIGDPEVQKEYKDYLEGLGFTDVSESKDRNYFHSIYFRSPAGALFEAAYSTPEGFLLDETFDELGKSFQLPPWMEDKRDELLAQLEPLDF